MTTDTPRHSYFRLERKLDEFVEEQRQATRAIQSKLEYAHTEAQLQVEVAKENNNAAQMINTQTKAAIEQTRDNIREGLRVYFIVITAAAAILGALAAMKLIDVTKIETEMKEELLKTRTELDKARELSDQLSLLHDNTRSDLEEGVENITATRDRMNELLRTAQEDADESFSLAADTQRYLTDLIATTQRQASDFLEELDDRDRQIEDRLTEEIKSEAQRFDAQYHYIQSLSHFNSERYPDALEAIEEAIKINSEDVEFWNRKGLTLRRLERYDEALEAYDSAIEIDREFGSAWNNRGFVLNILGRYEEALEALDRAIEIAPDMQHAHKNIGNTYSLLGDRDKALMHFRISVELAPNIVTLALEQGLYEALRDDEEFKQIVASARRR